MNATNYLTVIEQTPNGERAYDIYSRLLKERIVWFSGQVTEHSAQTICSQLLLLEHQNSNSPIFMYVNSPGGIVTEGMGIYDTMNFIKSPVATVVLGQACSMGSLIASNGEKGMRYMLPHSRHMIHQPSGGAQGQATDINIQANEIARMKKYLTDCYVNNTGQKFEKVERDLERDTFLSPQECVEYGLADHVIENMGDLSK